MPQNYEINAKQRLPGYIFRSMFFCVICSADILLPASIFPTEADFLPANPSGSLGPALEGTLNRHIWRPDGEEQLLRKVIVSFEHTY